MGLIFIESFSNYDRAMVINGARFENWRDTEIVDPTVGIVPAAATGRSGGGGVLLHTNTFIDGNDQYIHKMFDNYTTVIVGVAMKISTLTYSGGFLEAPERNSNKQIFAFYDGFQAQLSIFATPSNRIGVRLSQTSTVLARSSRLIRDDAFHYFECAATFNATTGSVRVRVDGEEWTDLALTNINTLTSGVAQCNGVRIGNNVQDGAQLRVRHFYYDDWYIAAVIPGTDHNDFVGDTYMTGALPVAIQGAQGWEPTSGTVHSTLVNDTLQSTSTASNIRTSGAGNTDLFRLGTISPTSGTIMGVAPNILARKDNAGVVRIAPIISNGVTAVRGSELYLGQSYQYHNQQVYEKNPIDNTQWPITLPSTLYFGVVKV